ncbi:MAG: glycoside hydrolase family 130 protein [candidate division Zixibacteria bacterium]
MHRYPHNPILTRNDIPPIQPHLIDVSSVFNPGAIIHNGKTVLLLRVQNRGRETFLMKASSPDGYKFEIDSHEIILNGIEKIESDIFHIYDPRIIYLDSRYYIVVTMDLESGCRLGLIVTDDFEKFDFLGILFDEDSRNGVLFPDKINGKYIMLDRPNVIRMVGNAPTGSAIRLMESDDLLTWWQSKILMKGKEHYWDELIGAGPPPIKTEQGWLLIYHGVATHFASSNIYQAGVALLELSNPGEIISRGKYNILEPREDYELIGQVPNVIFPTGAVVPGLPLGDTAKRKDELWLYYGAADTSICLATDKIGDLIDACFAGS